MRPAAVAPWRRASGRRWLGFAAALAATALVATGVAVGIDRALAAGGAAPHLTTVPRATLTRAGYALAPLAVPPYCGAVRAASTDGWLPSDLAGCPISREEAEAAAYPGGGRMVVEALLARVDAPGSSQIGQGRPVWLVVVRYSSLLMPMYLCPVPAVGAACPAVAPGFAATDVVFVDAHSGQQLGVLRVSSNSPLPPPTAAPGGTG